MKEGLFCLLVIIWDSIKNLCSSVIILENGILTFIGETVEAINSYLKISKEKIQSVIENRVDRIGTQLVVARYLTLKTIDDKLIETVITGQDFYLCLGFNNFTNKKLVNVIVSFSFTDLNGVPLLLIHNRMTGDKLMIDSPRGEFRCLIKKLPLNKGKYLLSYSIMPDNGNDGFFDGISNAFELNVEKGDFYNTGETAPINFGPLLMEGSFNIISKKKNEDQFIK